MGILSAGAVDLYRRTIAGTSDSNPGYLVDVAQVYRPVSGKGQFGGAVLTYPPIGSPTFEVRCLETPSRVNPVEEQAGAQFSSVIYVVVAFPIDADIRVTDRITINNGDSVFEVIGATIESNQSVTQDATLRRT